MEQIITNEESVLAAETVPTEAEAVQAAAETVPAAEEAVPEKEDEIPGAAAPAEIKKKKKADKASRKAKKLKKAAKKKDKKLSKKTGIGKKNLIFESGSGIQISLKDLVNKLPKGCEAAYVKAEENKIYWVKGEENGAEDIW